MGKHAIGGMRSMMIPNRKADMRFRKKSYLRNKELIDREALIEWLKRIPLIDLSDGRGICRVIMENDFKKAIKKMPKGIIADVAPVRHGRWDDYGAGVCCTNCGVSLFHQDENNNFGIEPSGFRYCPHCGAKMDGDGNG